MNKILITGVNGFVGKHFLVFLNSLNKGFKVLGIDYLDNEVNKFNSLDYDYKSVDLLNEGKIREIIESFKPDAIIHLASFSSVAFSWENPNSSFIHNMNIFLNLIESVRVSGIDCRILSVGSSEEYGILDESMLPIHEYQRLDPKSPYAVARVAQELISKVYVDGYNMDIILTRSFNHIGPGQKDTFVVPSLAKQVIKQMGNKEIIIKAGDVSIVRDFVDVRDVVRAYYLLLCNGNKGEVYNVCTGVGRSLKEIILKMASLIGKEIRILQDPALIRPIDNPVIIGSFNKIKKCTGWMPEKLFEESLEDILKYWRSVNESSL